jgi:pyrroloquinoline quinone (PQQ) biosynthesis protein C
VENQYQLEIARAVHDLRCHKVLNNPFFDIWANKKLDFIQMEIFAINYFEWIRTTPHNIALVFLNTNNIEARCETVKNLFDEMGYGEPKNAHTVILQDFLETLLSKMKGEKFQLAQDQKKILLSTRELVKKQDEFFGNSDLRVSYGTLLAQEWHAYTMLSKLYEGVRSYRHLYENAEEFNESCEYFYIHIGKSEKEHKIQSLNTANQYCQSIDDLKLIKYGFNTFIELLYDFWMGIYKKVTSFEINEKTPDNSRIEMFAT